jgi:hypothetical protein
MSNNVPTALEQFFDALVTVNGTAMTKRPTLAMTGGVTGTDDPINNATILHFAGEGLSPPPPPRRGQYAPAQRAGNGARRLVEIDGPASYDAEPGDLVSLDLSAGPVNLRFPETASPGARVGVAVLLGDGRHPVMLDGRGRSIVGPGDRLDSGSWDWVLTRGVWYPVIAG